jgi:bifunctional pyridoxal-dependent enzyme with beta-cystathionase and maltose regulon repressor activities
LCFLGVSDFIFGTIFSTSSRIKRSHSFFAAQVAVQTASLAFASGCHSIVFTPGYQSTVESPNWVVNNQGITKIERRPENNWQIDPERLRCAIRENTKYLIINEPHNPGEFEFYSVTLFLSNAIAFQLQLNYTHHIGLGGIVMTTELQNEVIEICRKHDIVILCDEVYRLLEHNPSEIRLDTVIPV